jgi:hypothetical protein
LIKTHRHKIKEERKKLILPSMFTNFAKGTASDGFFTNQRPMTAIAPMLAAQELGIPTATFIFLLG